MKFGKSKLVFSSICLIAALALAIFTVYAWFVTFTSVPTNGIDTVITSGDVMSFDIDYYYVSRDENEFIVGEPIDIDEEDAIRKMLNYSPSIDEDDDHSTAVLLDLRLKFNKAGNFEMIAKSVSAGVYSRVYEDYKNENYLSNVISLHKVNGNTIQGGKFSLDTEKDYNFITNEEGETVYFNGNDDESKKHSSVALFEKYTVEDGETGADNEKHIYLVIDYMPSQISSMYSIMLQIFPTQARLSDEIKYQNDIIFEIGKANS